MLKYLKESLKKMRKALAFSASMGDVLIDNAVDLEGGTRLRAVEIETYLGDLLP